MPVAVGPGRTAHAPQASHPTRPSGPPYPGATTGASCWNPVASRAGARTIGDVIRPEIMEYYRRGGERHRLSSGQGRLEYLRTWDVLTRVLPGADAVLMLGPLYHLTDRTDRILAWREAARALRTGGVVVAATISRFASLFDGFVKGYLTIRTSCPS